MLPGAAAPRIPARCSAGFPSLPSNSLPTTATETAATAAPAAEKARRGYPAGFHTIWGCSRFPRVSPAGNILGIFGKANMFWKFCHTLFYSLFPPLLIGCGRELVAQCDGAVIVENEPQHIGIHRAQAAACLRLQHLFCYFVGSLII